jgi:hypothetical protein
MVQILANPKSHINPFPRIINKNTGPAAGTGVDHTHRARKYLVSLSLFCGLLPAAICRGL